MGKKRIENSLAYAMKNAAQAREGEKGIKHSRERMMRYLRNHVDAFSYWGSVDDGTWGMGWYFSDGSSMIFDLSNEVSIKYDFSAWKMLKANSGLILTGSQYFKCLADGSLESCVGDTIMLLQGRDEIEVDVAEIEEIYGHCLDKLDITDETDKHPSPIPIDLDKENQSFCSNENAGQEGNSDEKDDSGSTGF